MVDYTNQKLIHFKFSHDGNLKDNSLRNNLALYFK